MGMNDLLLTKHFPLLFQLPVADPFLEKVNLSDFGKFLNSPLKWHPVHSAPSP